MIDKIKNLLRESGLFWDKERVTADGVTLEYYKALDGCVDIYLSGVISVLVIQDGISNWVELMPEDIYEIPRLLRTNFKLLDEYNTETKTWQEWDKHEFDGLRIMDPDGFRDYPFDKLYTKEEFLKIRVQSTVTGTIKTMKKYYEKVA